MTPECAKPDGAGAERQDAAGLHAAEVCFSTNPGEDERMGAPELVILVLLVSVVGLLAWGFKDPEVWRLLGVVTIVLARLLSVISVAGGVGLLVCGIVGAFSPHFRTWEGSTAILVGAGAGFLVGGILLLVLSFVSRASGRTSRSKGSPTFWRASRVPATCAASRPL